MVRTKKVYRKQILEGAYSLVLEEGFKRFQARNIAKRISCSTQPIYREFDNLAEVRLALEATVKDKYTDFLQEHSPETINELCQTVISYAKENPLEFQRFFLEEKNTSSDLKAITKEWFLKLHTLPAPVTSFFNLFWCYIIGLASLSSNQIEETFENLDSFTDLFNQQVAAK